MSLIATLISHPAKCAVSAGLVDKASKNVKATSTRWLAAETACDLVLSDGAALAEIEAGLRSLCAGEPVDVVVQPAANRRKQLLLADMDSTMIDQECIDELADEVGLKEKVATITARSMNGEIAFEPALRERVALLNGLDVSVIDRIINTRITLASGGPQLVATMRKNGAYAALVSGGFTVFTSVIAARLGFDENRANLLFAENGKLTGKVQEPILGREAKATALHEITARLNITADDVIAVGDGANDLDMLTLAGSGVALHAKPSVAEKARIRINHGDLTALLFIQGYAETDFVL